MTVVVDSDAFGGAERYAAYLLSAMSAGLWRPLVVSQPVAGHFDAASYPVIVVPLARHQERAPAITQALLDPAPDVVLLNLDDLLRGVWSGVHAPLR